MGAAGDGRGGSASFEAVVFTRGGQLLEFGFIAGEGEGEGPGRRERGEGRRRDGREREGSWRSSSPLVQWALFLRQRESLLDSTLVGRKNNGELREGASLPGGEGPDLARLPQLIQLRRKSVSDVASARLPKKLWRLGLAAALSLSFFPLQTFFMFSLSRSVAAKRVRLSGCSALRVGRVSGYSSEAPAPRANTDYLEPTHLDDSPSQGVLDRLARYSAVSLATYSRPPFILSHGKRCSVWDTEGRKYLDFSGGIAVNALGHADEGVQAVIADQSGLLVHNSNLWHNEWAGELATLLVDSTKSLGGMGFVAGAPVDESAEPGASSGLKVFFSNSGTEANEGALKFARKWGKGAVTEGGKSNLDKFEIVSFTDGFHGRSMGALSATHQKKYQAPFEPLVPGFIEAALNDIEALQTKITERTCGVIIEPIQVGPTRCR